MYFVQKNNRYFLRNIGYFFANILSSESALTEFLSKLQLRVCHELFDSRFVFAFAD